MARGVIRSRAPGPIPITASRPRGRARATATVACALARLAASSTDPGSISAAASATLGVPTARRTTSLGLGTGTEASRLAGKVTTGHPRPAAAAQVAARLDGEAQVGAELVQARAAGRVAGGGDDGFGAQGRGQPAGQLVAAAGVRAEHRDRITQRLVDADHGGVLVLAREQGREQPDGG